MPAPTACAEATRPAGKSFLLNHVIERLRQTYGDDFANSVAVTAATGIAATHFGGVPRACGTPRLSS